MIVAIVLTAIHDSIITIRIASTNSNSPPAHSSALSPITPTEAQESATTTCQTQTPHSPRSSHSPPPLRTNTQNPIPHHYPSISAQNSPQTHYTAKLSVPTPRTSSVTPSATALSNTLAWRSLSPSTRGAEFRRARAAALGLLTRRAD